VLFLIPNLEQFVLLVNSPTDRNPSTNLIISWLYISGSFTHTHIAKWHTLEVHY
jgi:hypothetical protein